MGAASNAVNDAGLKDSPDNPFAGPAGMSRIADIWVGTIWFLEEIEREWGSGFKSRDLIPAKYLGKVDGVVAAAPVAAVPAAAPAPAPAAAPVAAAPVAGAPDLLRVQVTALAGSISDHATFVTAAMAMPGVAADGTLVSEIVAPDGLWAAAQS
jgi:hypothetical protein